MMKQNKKPEWEVNEPRFNQLNYNESLLTNLNYYSVEVDSKLKQRWALDYFKDQNIDVIGLDKLNPMLFDQMGVLARLIKRGVQISDNNKSYLQTKLATLRSMIPKQERKVKAIEKIIPVKNFNNSDQLLSEIDTEIDAVIADEIEIKPIRIKLLINELNLKKDDFVYIKEYLTKQKKYYDEVLNDDGDLHESYSHVSKKTIKRIIKFIDEVHGMCGVSKILRERKVKEKSPALMTKSFQYLPKDIDLNVTSIPPEKIINASEVWIYDTDKRKLGKYKANDGDKLTIKGTTILNWDYELSSQKTVRKPSEIINKFVTDKKSELDKLFNSIKSVNMEVKGRTNKSVLILRVF